MSHNQLAHLALAAVTEREDRFVTAYRMMNWEIEPAQSYVRGVHLALAAGAHQIARRLAAMGSERFPTNRELQKMAAILAAPTVRRRREKSRTDLIANKAWLTAHREEYRGRWVALQEGQLLAEAPSAAALAEQIGEIKHRGILITQVF